MNDDKQLGAAASASEPALSASPTEPVPGSALTGNDRAQIANDFHRGWSITWDYGFYTATSPDYDASYEGEEDGWVDNGQRVQARTRDDLIIEIDAYLEGHSDAAG
jgi:hypothetical protein